MLFRKSVPIKQGFSAAQMNEILGGLIHKVDVSVYADTRYDWEQMQEICAGLIDGIDVSRYADPSIPASKMEEIREKLMTESSDAK